MKNYKSLFGNLVLGQWPNITAKNASGPSAQDGTPFTDDFINDIWGFMQATMLSAGLSPDGQNESSDASQLLKAIRKIIQNITFYPGCLFKQLPGDYDPIELKAMGIFPADFHWEIWNHRAELYELVPASSYPSSGALTVYASGQNVAANAYCIYQLTGDDRQIWKAKKAISNTPEQINPLDWELLPNITRVRRRDLQPDWTSDDLEIGEEVSYNGTSYRVVGILVLGGKFPSFAGGNRPPFINGGVAGDAIRNITGTAKFDSPGASMGGASVKTASGAFTRTTSYTTWSSYSYDQITGRGLDLDPSLIVPTGAENSPRTISVLYWRRVS